MGGLFGGQGPTAFDAIASAIAAGLYLLVGGLAVLRAPRDVRTRVFFLTAMASIAPYTATTYAWRFGGNAALARPIVGLVTVSLIVGSVALLHFMQIFPWRRPWIRAHGAWLVAAYAMLPPAAAAAVWKGPSLDFLTAPVDPAAGVQLPYVQISVAEGLALLALVVSIVVIVGIVIPFAGLLSLYKTWRAAKRHGIEPARITTFWILISQLAGGVLTILVIPLLDLAAGRGWWTMTAAALLFAFSMLMPIAFAAGVWKYRILEIDIDAAPAGL